MQQVEDFQAGQLRDETLPQLMAGDEQQADTPDSFIDQIDAPIEQAMAEETRVVTPSTVIETILTSIDVTTSMLDVIGPEAVATLETLLAKAVSLDAKDGYMRVEVIRAKHDIIREVSSWQMANSQTPDMQLLQTSIDEQQAAIASGPRIKAHPSAYSDLADTILVAVNVAMQTVDASTDVMNMQLSRASDLYATAREILQDSLRRTADIPSHHVAALTSSNYCAVCDAHLVRSCLAAQQHDQQSSAIALEAARNVSLSALDVLSGPFKVASSVATVQIPNFSRIAKAIARNDRRTLSASREAVLCISRAYLFHYIWNAAPQQPEEFRNLHVLLKAVWPDQQDRRTAMESYISQFDGGGISYFASMHSWRTEAQVWQEVITSIE